MSKKPLLCLKEVSVDNGVFRSMLGSSRSMVYEIGRATKSSIGPLFARPYTEDGLIDLQRHIRSIREVGLKDTILVCEYKPYKQVVERWISPLYVGVMRESEFKLFWSDWPAFYAKFEKEIKDIVFEAVAHYDNITVDVSANHVFACEMKPIKEIEWDITWEALNETKSV